MKNFLLATFSLLCLVACSSEDSVTPVSTRTVMIYLNSENNISGWASQDVKEIVTGSKNVPSDCNVLVFYDNTSTHNSYIYKMENGTQTTVKSYSNLDASSPENMLSVLQTMIQLYPASEYVTVFWGHGTGAWITTDTSKAVSKAYGADYNGYSTGINATWINIPQLAQVLGQLPKQKLILFDACLMQNVECDYELRNCTDYIVASASETPSFGANFATMTPILASTSAEDLPKAVIDNYTGPLNLWSSYRDQFTNCAMSAVKTSKLDNLLSATKNVMDTIPTGYLTTTFPQDAHGATNCIFYFRESTDLEKGSTSRVPIFHDMKDVMRHNLSTADFNSWNTAFNNAVVYSNSNIIKTMDIRNTGVKAWISDYLSTSDFRLFYIDNETCGALSMYIPDNSSRTMNTTRLNYQWWQKIMPQ